jgi:hypothetical protein
LIKPRPFLPPISIAFFFLSFTSAAIGFKIGSCLSPGGGATLDALAAALRSLAADFDDPVSRTDPLAVLGVWVPEVTMAKCFMKGMYAKSDADVIWIAS